MVTPREAPPLPPELGVVRAPEGPRAAASLPATSCTGPVDRTVQETVTVCPPMIAVPSVSVTAEPPTATLADAVAPPPPSTFTA